MTVRDLWAGRGVSGQAKLAHAEICGQSVADVKFAATAKGDASGLDFSGSVGGSR